MMELSITPSAERVRMTGSLILIVGPDEADRAQIAATLIGKGDQVLLCGGPPNCSLSHEDGCVLARMAEMVVVLPGMLDDARSLPSIQECARTVGRALFVHAPPFALPEGSIVARTPDPRAVATKAHEMLI